MKTCWAGPQLVFTFDNRFFRHQACYAYNLLPARPGYMSYQAKHLGMLVSGQPHSDSFGNVLNRLAFAHWPLPSSMVWNVRAFYFRNNVSRLKWTQKEEERGVFLAQMEPGTSTYSRKYVGYAAGTKVSKIIETYAKKILSKKRLNFFMKSLHFTKHLQ